MSKRYIFNSFIWGMAAKIFDAAVKFISVPLLLSYFGEGDFGLITLATSVNAYIQLLDMGVNTGAIKFFSEWIASRRMDLLDTTARTSITFYGIVGIINALVLIGVALFGMTMFSVTPHQSEVLKILFLILSLFAILNWSTSVFSQLLTANHDIKYIQKVNLVKTVLNFIIIYMTMWFKLNIEIYFVLFCITNSFIVIPYYIKSKKSGLISGCWPKRDWAHFSIIFKYSMALMAMGVFQMSATKLRPVILGVFSKDTTRMLTEYRILETITLFIISIGGMFISILLPMTSKLTLEGVQEKINAFAYKTTLFTTVICTFLCIPFVVGGREILELYVGAKYASLYPWLVTWVLTILLFLHNSPIASLVLSTGKIRMLVFSSAISCTVSLVINAWGVRYLGVGSAILGYAIYILIQVSFYYFYFNKEVLRIDSLQVFRSFCIPALLGALMAVVTIMFSLSFKTLLVNLFAKVTVWFILYTASLLIFRILKIGDLKDMLMKKAI
ncbi:MAG: polysaccharide biosynthesis C-terminal domain-containing protein [Niabella sp.]